jgi:hypothetical protein
VPAGPATTANPSIAELSKGGTSMALVTSSASTRPSADPSATGSSPSRVTASSTRRRASSIAISSLTGAIFSEISPTVRRFRGYDRRQ